MLESVLVGEGEVKVVFGVVVLAFDGADGAGCVEGDVEVGLAGGAAIIGRLAARTRDPVGWLSVNHLAVAVLAGGSYLLADKLPFVFLFLIRGESLGADTVQFAQFLMALLVMLPPPSPWAASCP